MPPSIARRGRHFCFFLPFPLYFFVRKEEASLPMGYEGMHSDMIGKRNGTTALTTRRAKTKQVCVVLERELGLPVQSSTLPPPLDVLIATVLSQNTNDKNSHRAYVGLRSRFPTWEQASVAPTRSIAAVIRTGGMADQKSKRIKEILHRVYDRLHAYSLDPLRKSSNQKIMDWLTSLPGIGPKTAACVILFALGRDIFPVDTHVHRVCNRLGITNGARTPEETFREMADVVPKEKGYSFHTNLIRFGRMICRSTRPLCGECPLYDLCVYTEKTVRTRSTVSRTDHHFMLLDNVRS